MGGIDTLEEVELRPHVGRHLLTGELISQAQDMVFVNGEHVGFIGHHDNAKVVLIVKPSASELLSISKAVMRERGYIPEIKEPPKAIEGDLGVVERLSRSR